MITIIDGTDVPHPEDSAMLQALQSRSPAPVAERLEALKGRDVGSWMQKYYVGYGHKSIGDCGTVTIYIEGVPMLVAKAIQDWPLYAGQECSTRYMDWSTVPFANPGGSKLGAEIQATWRALYLRLKPLVIADLEEQNPRGAEDEGTYKRAIAARAFDILRGFLPAGAITNLSWTTNLRQARDHLEWLLSHPDPQVWETAQEIYAALRRRYPASFPADTDDDVAAKYQVEAMQGYYTAPDLYGPRTQIQLRMDQRYWPPGAMQILCERPRGQEVPWFLAEIGSVETRLRIDYGSFRDLARHRAGVIRMPLLTTQHGIHPWYRDQLPVDISAELIEQEHRIAQLKCGDVMRQYYCAMGHQVDVRLVQPLPAWIYRVELRSSLSVHPTLRETTREEAKQFRAKLPWCPLHTDDHPDGYNVRRGTQSIFEK